jgi:hypothetical protein
MFDNLSEVTLPLALSVIAGLGTFVGGCILLVLLPQPPHTAALPASSSLHLGQLLAASSGVMLSLSMFVLNAIHSMHTHI